MMERIIYKDRECFLTHSIYDVKSFLETHNCYCRIAYILPDEAWILSTDYIHMQMLYTAEESGKLGRAESPRNIAGYLYYMPSPPSWSSVEKYIEKSYVEVSDAAIYEKFMLGRSGISSEEAFQKFIDIFGKPIELIKIMRYHHEDNNRNHSENDAVTGCYGHGVRHIPTNPRYIQWIRDTHKSL